MVEKISGYGAIREFDLSIQNVIEEVESLEVNEGKFIKKYKIEKSTGGLILRFSAELKGARNTLP